MIRTACGALIWGVSLFALCVSSGFADEGAPPALTIVSEAPARGTSGVGLTEISVTFSAEVKYVTASALTVDGATAKSVSGSGAGPYVFAVNPPTSGIVQVALAAATVESVAGAPFEGDSWTLFNPPTTLLSMPDTVVGAPGAIIQVPITAAPTDGILGIDMTINYDPAIVSATNVTTSGIAAAAGFGLVANLTTPGVIIITTYATVSAMSGSGEIARVEFHVLGAPGATSALGFTRASINEGGIGRVLDPGLFTVTCAGVANGTACNDGNACTTADHCSAGVCTGTAIAAPGEIAGVSFLSDGATIAWNAAAEAGVLYDVVRGHLATLPVGPGGGDEVCEANDLTTTSFTDTTPVAEGDGFWYLVRAVNACAQGTYGNGNPDGGPPTVRTTNTCQ